MSYVRSDNSPLGWPARDGLSGTVALRPMGGRNILLRAVAARWQLFKPRVLGLVLVVCVFSGLLAGPVDLNRLAMATLATGLIAGAGLIVNQIMERDVDAIMERTRNRPLPSGAVTVGEAWGWSVVLGAAGIACFLAADLMLALGLSLLSAVLYVAIYTPLKRITPLNTVIGAISGAMPPLIGWAAVRGTLDPLAWLLFGLLFLWQFPHFFAIAWLWRDEYRRAGLRMISVADPDGRRTGRQAVLYCLPLLPLSLLAAPAGAGAILYGLLALVLGAVFLACSVEFWWKPSDRTARQLLRASVLYLPILLALMLVVRY